MYDFWEAWAIHTFIVIAAGVLLFSLIVLGYALWLTGFFWETLSFFVFSALIRLSFTLRIT